MTIETFSIDVMYQAEALLLGEGSRFFNFVLDSFGITWSNLLKLLVRGGFSLYTLRMEAYEWLCRRVQ